jgi:uncharacterized protein YfaT (DUF1175 family)
VQLSVTRDWRFRGRSLGLGFVLIVALALLIVLALIRLFWLSRRVSHFPKANRANVARAAALDFGDRFGDGTPDFLRLTDPADQAAFRRWFTLIAEDAASRPKSEVPAEITDCASLLRYAYRESLGRHDDAWLAASGLHIGAPPGEIGKWHYPDTPLGLALFRVREGPFGEPDLDDGAFAQFADAKTLVERNAFMVSRDVRAALPGDLLFYRQFGHASPWHSMIVTRVGSSAVVVYHTGPDHPPHGRGPVRGDPGHGNPGELRSVMISDLLDHPQPEWRPVPGNPNFLGVFRWNILRGTS